MTIHVMTLAERLASEADRLDPPYLHEFNEKGQRLGHHPHAYLLRQAATELRNADEAAKSWYAAASPYGTPNALREALYLYEKALTMIAGFTGSVGGRPMRPEEKLSWAQEFAREALQGIDPTTGKPQHPTPPRSPIADVPATHA